MPIKGHGTRRACRESEEYTSLTAVRSAIKHAKTKEAEDSTALWSWQCNECGSNEFTTSVREEDLENLSCTSCGGNEFHKVHAR